MTDPGVSIRPMRPDDRAHVLQVWERSVRATHAFLAEADIVELRPHVAAALAGDAVDWWVLVSSAEAIVGFTPTLVSGG